jgi:Icc-related predicted phosphoesterase
VNGFEFYGMPWTPYFHDWAFNYTSNDAEDIMARIPSSTDVLLTHGPPLNCGDQTLEGKHVGCPVLRAHVNDRIKPALHVFGHIHCQYGFHAADGTTLSIGVSTCTEQYQPTNPPIVVDLSRNADGLVESTLVSVFGKALTE